MPSLLQIRQELDSAGAGWLRWTGYLGGLQMEHAVRLGTVECGPQIVHLFVLVKRSRGPGEDPVAALHGASSFSYFP